MRGPRLSLSEAVVRSSGSGCSSTFSRHIAPCVRRPQASSLHTASYSSTETATSSAPHLQDLVNDSLGPSYLSSSIVASVTKEQRKLKAATAKTSKQHGESVQGAPLVRSVASTSATASSTSKAKMLNNRSQLTIRLVRNNRILSAMTAFVEDLADPSRTPHTLKELEDLILALRIQCKQQATSRPAPNLSDVSTELWRPSRLDPSISAKSLSIPAQCMYAMSTIYDAGIELKYRPTAKMVSALLSTFAGNLNAEQMYQAAEAALNHLVPPTAPDPESYLRMINHQALASFIKTYGRIGKPELGEQLLARWSHAQSTTKAQGGATLLHADETIDMSGWGNNAIMWSTLIQARADSGDVSGARLWLDRYRAATSKAPSTESTGKTARPAVQPEPYLAYLNGLRDAHNFSQSRPVSDEDDVDASYAPVLSAAENVTSEVRETVRLMVSDRVFLDSSVLAFIISFEAKIGNVVGGASLVEELGDVIRTASRSDADTLRALLQLRKAASDRAANTETMLGPMRLDGVPSTRALIRSVIRVGEGDAYAKRANLASCRSRGTLNDALHAAMADRDYPAAVVVLNLFERWRQTPSHTTYSIVLNALVTQGHHLAFFANPGELTESNSKFNLESTLHSMARDGNGDQADLIRRAVGNKLDDNEGFFVSANPDYTLRQTQYMIRVLNRVCAAEIEFDGPDHAKPAWLRDHPSSGHPDKPTHPLPEDHVWKKVRSVIYAAQDSLLGPKETRRQLKPSQKAPLFTSSPALSPRRRTYLSKPNSNKYAHTPRSFSTSSRAYNGSSGASCDLASAASGDYTHLDPVRAVYLPGFVPYEIGLALQEHLVKERADARAALRTLSDSSSSSASTLSGHTSITPSASEEALRRQATQDTLLLLQHRPVYTEGRRSDTENSLLSNHLRSLGAEYHLTKRGGQITYHGPGQLVGYPILNLASMNLASRCYVDRIQDSLISLLAQRGIPTVSPPENHTGVWADEYHKLASIGIQVRHRITSHGFALNVEKRAMQGFRHITACGIVGRNMTCIHDRLDPLGPFAKYNNLPEEGEVDKEERVESVAQSYMSHFAKVFGRRVREVREEEFEFALERDEHAESLKKGLKIDVEEHERVVTKIKVDGKLVVYP